jgi:hypothetical protein
MTSFSKPTAMMNTLAVGNFRAVQVGTRMGSRVVQSEIKDVSYPGGDSVRVYVECHKDIYPDYSSLRVHMLTGGSKDDIHYMLDDRDPAEPYRHQSLDCRQHACPPRRRRRCRRRWRPAGSFVVADTTTAGNDEARCRPN